MITGKHSRQGPSTFLQAAFSTQDCSLVQVYTIPTTNQVYLLFLMNRVASPVSSGYTCTCTIQWSHNTPGLKVQVN